MGSAVDEGHDPLDEPDAAGAEQRFREDLVGRGEAARATDGELPPEATHEIVDDDDGEPSLVRRRFSAS